MHPNSYSSEAFSRRGFLKLAAIAPAAILAPTLGTQALGAPAPSSRKLPIGLELYSVRAELARDLPGALRQVAAMGYQAVEFFAPYTDWTAPYAKDVRSRLDDLGLRCYSTHNRLDSFSGGPAMAKAIELNQILGTKYLILASIPKSGTVEAWKKLGGVLTTAAGQLRPHGLTAGCHNHSAEWAQMGGAQRGMDLMAANTPPDFALQLDVGTCVAAGADPVAWINANPGRIKSVHLKDWAPGDKAAEKGYRVLFGEGVAPWAEILAAAEATGGVEFYLMEQEGSRYPDFEGVKRCLESWKQMRGLALQP
jgi:sugar phosphate isomerase/epimerase